MQLGQIEVAEFRDMFAADGGKHFLWFVLHVRARQEKALAGDLEGLDVDYFLPLVMKIRYYGKRKRTVKLPLFPGYVFLRGSIEQVYTADRTRRVLSIIPVKDQGGLNWELKNLHLALVKGVTLDPYPTLKANVRVEVRSGPLRGLQGVIESRTRANRLVLQVAMLGSAVSLEVDGSLLDPV